MTTEEQNTITNFIGKIANKDYSDAQQALENAVAAKLKTKIKTYIEQEK
jgi:hypothetical protein